ncbi:hypothetical protein ABKS89_28945 [Pseudomonas sp. LABIM340]|uniref:hypothetical protein n=1 Tax=Pseudomonas sp. LABIM340 TaxID=3156585 RepID=UPI0032AF02A9
MKAAKKYIYTLTLAAIYPLTSQAMETTLPGHSSSSSVELKDPYPPIRMLEGDYTISPKEFALKTCLDTNYEKLDSYKAKELMDHTSLSKNMPPAKILKLIDFTKAHTSFFHTENLPIKSESHPPPYNAIFGRCIHFYKSQGLSDFIQNLEHEN